MEHTHRIDRFMAKHRRTFYLLGALTIWPSFFFFAWGFRVLIDVIGPLWAIPVALCYILTLIGLASLFDDLRQEQRNQQPDR